MGGGGVALDLGGGVSRWERELREAGGSKHITHIRAIVGIWV